MSKVIKYPIEEEKMFLPDDDHPSILKPPNVDYGTDMSKSKNDNETVNLEELVISNVYSIEAIVQLLIDKGLLTQEEILTKIKEIQIKNKRAKVN